MEGTLGFAEHGFLRGTSWEAALPEGTAQVGEPAASLAQAGLPGGHVTGVQHRTPGKGGSSSRPRHAPATEGVRATRVGVTNLGASNRNRGVFDAAKAAESP